ncbi:30S ribosomal protein S6 [Paenibacillus antri]|uniref:Small ribosomal subunit protein bS6 n=2 Tax=Paenibacillus TaxID=44249 RepID=A0A5R9G790_9BACL|nr:30S ribosomal protein S6 [Paenibacillus antri]TLS48884.1 30S ribosomal protein S6 [Paenibacillus antri]
MRKYEIMYIVRSDVEEAAVQAIVERFQGIINNGGEVTKTNVMGKRRLAYEINKNRDGIYVLVNFTATPEIVKELDRVMRITDEVIRFMIVQDVA